MATFTTIPPEITNEIYKLILLRDGDLVVTSPQKRGKRQTKRSPPAASLLRVNKQINAEAKTIFFGYNTFVLGTASCGSTINQTYTVYSIFLRECQRTALVLSEKFT